MTKPALVVLAAGMGSRFGGLKQLAGLGPNGEVLMEYSVFDALKAGFSRVVFIIRKDIEAAFREYVLSRFPADLPYALVYQELDALPEGFSLTEGRTKPWGTSHALWCARHEVKENFAVLNADDFYGASGFRKISTFFQSADFQPGIGSLVGYRLEKTLSESGTVTRGICRANAEGFLVDIEETSEIGFANGKLSGQTSKGILSLNGQELASMNFWGFHPSVFDQLDKAFEPWLAENGTQLKTEFLLPQTIGALVKEGKIRIQVLDSDDAWVGVTYAEDQDSTRKHLAQLHERKVYPSKLWD